MTFSSGEIIFIPIRDYYDHFLAFWLQSYIQTKAEQRPLKTTNYQNTHLFGTTQNKDLFVSTNN